MFMGFNLVNLYKFMFVLVWFVCVSMLLFFVIKGKICFGRIKLFGLVVFLYNNLIVKCFLKVEILVLVFLVLMEIVKVVLWLELFMLIIGGNLNFFVKFLVKDM